MRKFLIKLKEYFPCSWTGHLFYWQGNVVKNNKVVKIRDHWICRCGETKMDLWSEKDKSILGKIKQIFKK